MMNNPTKIQTQPATLIFHFLRIINLPPADVFVPFYAAEGAK